MDTYASVSRSLELSPQLITYGRSLVERHLKKGAICREVEETKPIANYEVRNRRMRLEWNQYHFWRRPDENFAFPVFFNSREARGSYLGLIYGPLDERTDLKKVSWIGFVLVNADNYLPDEKRLVVQCSEDFPGLFLALRLVQGERKSEQVCQPLKRIVSFRFPDFSVETGFSPPLRMTLWLTGMLLAR